MRGILTFLRDDRGSQTIEFVLWLPITVALLIIIIDASMLYLTHTEMWNVARDTARRMTTGVLATEDEAKAYAKDQLNLYRTFDSGYIVFAQKDPDTAMTVVITLSLSDASIITSYFGLDLLEILPGTMAARVVMRSEPT
jgi:vancomycin permeability regulator SanA